MTYKIGSLFDGSGGFPLAGTLCGIEPAWASEVEPYPIAVTRSRFPKMKHLGDITKVNGAAVEPVDIITFGSPCQDLSVAGKQAGIKHAVNGDEETTRSGLFMEAVRIIKEMRIATNGKYPKFCIWENVPGAFSSNRGQDFRIVLEELIKIVEPSASMPDVPKNGWAYADSYVGDGWSLAYRLFDAQYWGVPQRRRRIHLVLDLTGECARSVLFEREGVRGYFTQGGTPWQATPADAQGSPGADDCEGEGFDGYNGDIEHRDGRGRQLDDLVPYLRKIRQGCEGGGKGALIQTDKSATLATNNDQYLFQPVPDAVGVDLYNQATTGDKAIALRASAAKGPDGTPCVAYSVENHPADSRVSLDETGKVQTPTSRMGTGGGNVPMVMEPFCKSRRAQTADDVTTWKPATVANTMNAFDQGETRVNELIVEERPVYALDRASFNQGENAKYDAEITDSGVNSTIVARGPSAVAYAAGLNESQVSHTLIARMESAVGTTQDNLIISDYREPTRYIVRRLTPIECARLQGFADQHGDIDNKKHLTDEEYLFWLGVRQTYDAINGRADKDYTEKQMLTWYNKLHTDSAEYKMWGNGIALPPALYVMQGIRDALDAPVDEDDWMN